MIPWSYRKQTLPAVRGAATCGIRTCDIISTPTCQTGSYPASGNKSTLPNIIMYNLSDQLPPNLHLFEITKRGTMNMNTYNIYKENLTISFFLMWCEFHVLNTSCYPLEHCDCCSTSRLRYSPSCWYGPSRGSITSLLALLPIHPNPHWPKTQVLSQHKTLSTYLSATIHTLPCSLTYTYCSDGNKTFWETPLTS